jgi:superfamily I DNA/RNA helicase
MASEQLIFGPPGCGKTYTMMEIIKTELESGTASDRIGFVSFTKKAITEARERAGVNFELTAKDTPFFRTLHSMGFYCCGMRSEDIVSRYDFKKLGLELGMSFDNHNVYDADGLLIPSASEGNKYLTLIQRAAMRMISLEQEFNSNGDYGLEYSVLEKVDAVYKSYKGEFGKFDFTDMVKLMVEQDQGPRLDALIVDEAQDLTPLQWEQVKVLKKNAKRVWYAGDDDQAIFKWTGVDVKIMLGMTGSARILEQSYRVPRSVHRLAARIAGQISNRKEKIWSPTEREGNVSYYRHVSDIDMSEGSWTVMARTSKQLNEIGKSLQAQGILYKKNGRLSFDQDKAEAMQVWKKLQEQQTVSVDSANVLYEFLPKRGDKAAVAWGKTKTLSECDPMKPITYKALVEDHGLLVELGTPAEVVINLSEDERDYLYAIERRGGNLLEEPLIKLSTIHRMKGGEDDNIVLLNDMGYMPWKSYTEGDPDDEHRVFYTAVTRTKHHLHIVENATKFGYPL